jgi:CheY-like chemotaxis protein
LRDSKTSSRNSCVSDTKNFPYKVWCCISSHTDAVSIYEMSYYKIGKERILPNTLQILIASSTSGFLDRFGSAFRSVGVNVTTVSDGYEALTQLEQNGFDLLFVDGGELGRAPGLSGITGDELSQMWRQIEGRAAHLVIGYVSDIKMKQEARSGLWSDPADVARNRGIDYHFWNDEEDDSIVSQLVDEIIERRRDASEIAMRTMDSNVEHLPHYNRND